jgi:hypothetical protein
VQILKKFVDNNQRNWHLKVIEALWESRKTPKDSTGMSLYLSVYGKEAKMLINLELNALISVVNIEDTKDTLSIQKRINQLMKMEEERRKTLNRTSQRQKSVKRYFYQSTTMKNF